MEVVEGEVEEAVVVAAVVKEKGERAEVRWRRQRRVCGARKHASRNPGLSESLAATSRFRNIETSPRRTNPPIEARPPIANPPTYLPSTARHETHPLPQSGAPSVVRPSPIPSLRQRPSPRSPAPPIRPLPRRRPELHVGPRPAAAARALWAEEAWAWHSRLRSSSFSSSSFSSPRITPPTPLLTLPPQPQSQSPPLSSAPGSCAVLAGKPT